MKSCIRLAYCILCSSGIVYGSLDGNALSVHHNDSLLSFLVLKSLECFLHLISDQSSSSESPTLREFPWSYCFWDCSETAMTRVWHGRKLCPSWWARKRSIKRNGNWIYHRLQRLKNIPLVSASSSSHSNILEYSTRYITQDCIGAILNPNHSSGLYCSPWHFVRSCMVWLWWFSGFPICFFCTLWPL